MLKIKINRKEKGCDSLPGGGSSAGGGGEGEAKREPLALLSKKLLRVRKRPPCLVANAALIMCAVLWQCSGHVHACAVASLGLRCSRSPLPHPLPPLTSACPLPAVTTSAAGRHRRGDWRRVPAGLGGGRADRPAAEPRAEPVWSGARGHNE